MGFLGLGSAEVLLILVVLLIFFGKDKLPELARSIGKSYRELRAGFDKPDEKSPVVDVKKPDQPTDVQS